MAKFMSKHKVWATAFHEHTTRHTKPIGPLFVPYPLANVAYKIHVYTTTDIMGLNERLKLIRQYYSAERP